MSEAENKKSVIRSFPYTAQIDGSDCGAAALCMAARYFGINSVLSETRHICGSDVSGTQLCSAAESMGLKADFLRKDFNAVRKMPLPLITHWEGNHWLVIIGFKDGQVKIADPAAGIYWLPEADARTKYSGYVCTVSGSGDSLTAASGSNELLSSITPLKKALIPAAFMMLFIIAAELCVPHVAQRIIDENLLSDPAYLDWLTLFSTVTAGAAFFCWLLKEWLLTSSAARTEKLILNNLLKKWLHLPESFFKDRSFSELRVRLESVFEISRHLVNIAGKGLFALLEIIAVIAMLEFYKGALLFTFLFLPALALALYSFYLTRQYTGIFKLAKEDFLQKVDDSTRGIFSIRGSSAESVFSRSQRDARDRMYQMTASAERNLHLCEKGAAGLGISAALIYLVIKTSAYSRGDLEAGVLVALVVLVCIALKALFRILGERSNFAEGTVIYDCLNDVFDNRVDYVEKQKIERPGSISWKTSLSNREKDKMNLALESGASLFVCGDDRHLLLETLRNPAFVGVSLKAGDKEWTDQSEFPALSYMESHPHLFNISLAENVACGEPVDLQRVRWCLRLALAEYLESDLQYGLETKIISTQFDYADKMKIILARCLYRKRPLHVLEDVSDFLTDREIEFFVYHLARHSGDRTVIVSDSNVRIARGADSVIVLRHQKIIEQGTCAELLKQGGVFCKIFNNQIFGTNVKN